MSRTFPPLDLPDDVLSFEGEKFFELIRQKCGEVFKELMEILSINAVYKLLLVEDDILSVFQKKYRELEKVTQRACLHLDDGTIMLKPGLRMDFDRFMESLRTVNDQKKQQKKTVRQSDDVLSLFKTLVNSYKFNESNEVEDSYSFLFAFIENICNNITKIKIIIDTVILCNNLHNPCTS
jgi:hypothetical protein